MIHPFLSALACPFQRNTDPYRPHIHSYQTLMWGSLDNSFPNIVLSAQVVSITIRPEHPQSYQIADPRLHRSFFVSPLSIILGVNWRFRT